jgi:hypothetical protein
LWLQSRWSDRATCYEHQPAQVEALAQFFQPH